MTHSISNTKIAEGPNHAVFHVVLQSDGSSGELTNYVIVNPVTDLTPTLNGKPTLTIMEIWYEMLDFHLLFSFNSLTPTPVWPLSDSASNHICFDKVGGLKDRSPPLDGNG